MEKDLEQSTPLLSVVMSVYNDMKYVEEAINSILDQTFRDFEFIIINDGSTDNTKKIIESFRDPRIHIINQSNHGLVYSLNKGIKVAKGNYIARHDSDDISDRTRFQKQIDYLISHPGVVLLGSSMRVMDEKSNIKHTHHVLLHDIELKQELLVRSPFAHGSVLFKKQAAIDAGLYNNESWPAEDYDLWLRLSKFGEFANINEPLYIYRENSSGISQSNQSLQSKKSASIRKLAWATDKELLVPHASRISIAEYLSLKDGDTRIRRIKSNLIFGIRRSLTRANFILLKRLVVLLYTVTIERRGLNRKEL